MAELVDRLPGDPIQSAYANTIRDRTAQRYVDATARDNSVLFPTVGDLAYLTSQGDLTQYDGTRWVTMLDDTGGEMSGKLNGDGTGRLDDWDRITFGEVVPGSQGELRWHRTGFWGVAAYGAEVTAQAPAFFLRGLDGVGAEVGAITHKFGLGDEEEVAFVGFPNRDSWWEWSAPGGVVGEALQVFWDHSERAFSLRWGEDGNWVPGKLSYGGALTLENLSGITNRVQMTGPTSTTTGIGTVRNVYIGSGPPDAGVGEQGDLYIRYVP